MNRTVPDRRSGVCLTLFSFGLGVLLWLAIAKPGQAQTPGTFAEEFTAMFTADADAEARIHVFRWSTDAERNRLVVAIETPPPDPQAAPAGGRGGRGGGGRGRGGDDAEPVDPIAAAMAEAPTVGYIWTDSAVGYSIKYAYQEPLPNGGERIVLATNRRLAPRTPAEEELTFTEIRLDEGGSGEGRTASIAQTTTDGEADTVMLRDYDTAVPTLRNIRR